MARGVRLTPHVATGGARGWLALAAVLAIGAVVVTFAIDRHAVNPVSLDWQPWRAARSPWRAFSAAWVHYSGLHLAANVAGALVVAALGAVARVPRWAVWAWLLAWPGAQFGLFLRPDLAHYGGLSGVLHGGAAIVALYLVLDRDGAPRFIGMAIAAGLVLKTLLEAPWGEALRYPTGWDIAVAPFAHASGLVAGVVCGLAARTVARLEIGALVARRTGT